MDFFVETNLTKNPEQRGGLDRRISAWMKGGVSLGSWQPCARQQRHHDSIFQQLPVCATGTGSLLAR